MQDNLSQAIEAILFATSEPQSLNVLANRLGVTVEAITTALEPLKASLDGHGISVLMHDDSVTLVTSPQFTTLIETIRKEELSKELSKASAETLAVIAYIPGVSRAQIEFIRGVNVSYSLRSLQMRGLVESKGQGRSIGYYPTVQLLEHFGISSIEQLPLYTETKQKLEQLLQTESTQPQS